jgi:hypothetical protein
MAKVTQMKILGWQLHDAHERWGFPPIRVAHPVACAQVRSRLGWGPPQELQVPSRTVLGSSTCGRESVAGRDDSGRSAPRQKPARSMTSPISRLPRLPRPPKAALELHEAPSEHPLKPLRCLKKHHVRKIQARGVIWLLSTNRLVQEVQNG